jgi:hypothetical protein
MKINIYSTLSEAVTVLYIILFLYTGIDKITNYLVFREQLEVSAILTYVATLIASILPCVELITVVLLAIPKLRLKGLYVSLCLMVIFTGYIVAILCFDKDLPCSCGGLISQLSWKQHLIFNTLFIALAILGIYTEKKNKSIRRKVLMTIITNTYAR